MQDRMSQVLAGQTYIDPLTGEERASNVRIIATGSAPLTTRGGAMHKDLVEAFSGIVLQVPRNLDGRNSPYGWATERQFAATHERIAVA